jgi:hypothetical protein
VAGHRITACLLAVLSVVGAGAVAGCGPNAYRRELVVVFAASATPEQHAAALENCTGVAPNTSPEPIVHSSFASSRVYDVRFRIDHASDRDVAQLQACLAKQPGVVGTQDTGAN